MPILLLSSISRNGDEITVILIFCYEMVDTTKSVRIHKAMKMGIHSCEHCLTKRTYLYSIDTLFIAFDETDQQRPFHFATEDMRIRQTHFFFFVI